jgi:hypothetical protein
MNNNLSIIDITAHQHTLGTLMPTGNNDYWPEQSHLLERGAYTRHVTK